MRTPDNRFEALDTAALQRALLTLRTCPHCRGDLGVAAFYADVRLCPTCKESWFLPEHDEAVDPK